MAGGGVFITTLSTHALTVSIEQQIAGRIDSRPFASVSSQHSLT